MKTKNDSNGMPMGQVISEEIYTMYNEKHEINKQGSVKKKITNKNFSTGQWNEKYFMCNFLDSELDVQGILIADELWNQNDDEENNYYCIGGA